ncbi:hypothetical protein BN136_1315 [Cronobacter universalis NCTC 9529]|nr:hypothetical protein BN136_1315 [Cronobacter universalis NCTC 9529]
MYRAGDQTVDFVLLQHQRAEHHVIFQLLAGDRFGHPFALTQLNQTRHVAFTHHFRIDDFDAGAQFYALCGSNARDFIRVTQQHAGRDAAFGADGRRFHGTRLVAFRQHDAFARFTRKLGQLVAERRRRETTAALGRGGQGVDPLGADVACHIFLHFFNTLVVVSRHFKVEALQAERGLPGIGVHHKYRQAGGESAFAQLADALVHFITAGQQDGADFHAVHRGKAGGH